MDVPLARMAIRLVVPMAITMAIGTFVAILAIGAMAAVVMKFSTIITIDIISTIGATVANESPCVSIVVSGATGSIGAIDLLNDPLNLNGDYELSIAI